MESEFRFKYFRDSNRFPVACIATQVNRAANKVVVGLSTVHPLDKKGHYSKSRARMIAMERAATKPFIVELDPDETSAKDIMLAVVETLYEESKVPTRVHKLLKRWLDEAEPIAYPTIQAAIQAIKAPTSSKPQTLIESAPQSSTEAVS